jgi:DNA-binding beta-propeller fold protein YncE
MKAERYVYASALAGVLAIGAALWHPFNEAKADRAPTLDPPHFRVDPFWPKPLPDNWVTGEIGGTCIDSRDHLFVLTRGFQTGGLVSPEGVGGQPDPSKASPPVIEFNREGKVVNSWGDPSLVPATDPDGNAGKNAVLPNGTHGCFIDSQDNVWLAGNGDGVVQKWSHDGSTLLLQIGKKFVCDTPTGACANVGATGDSTTLLNLPADIAVDPHNGDVYIADGYGNHRIVVFDRDGNYLRHWGGAGSDPGQFFAGDGGHPHCVVMSRQGLIYACDRGNDRIQVFDKFGKLQRIIPVVPGTNALGTAGSAWDVDFSPDRAQTFMYESDGGNEVMWIFDHAAGKILSGFGRPGHMAGEFTFLHMMAIDSRGNLYVGETVGGRRVQKFVKRDSDRDDDHH